MFYSSMIIMDLVLKCQIVEKKPQKYSNSWIRWSLASAPKDVSKLWGFLGLAKFRTKSHRNHGSDEKLMRNDENTAYTWLDEHTAAFDQTKSILTKNLELHLFDPEMPTFLTTDASQLHSLGFALVQSHKGVNEPERLIQCGSWCLLSTQLIPRISLQLTLYPILVPRDFLLRMRWRSSQPLWMQRGIHANYYIEWKEKKAFWIIFNTYVIFFSM